MRAHDSRAISLLLVTTFWLAACGGEVDVFEDDPSLAPEAGTIDDLWGDQILGPFGPVEAAADWPDRFRMTAPLEVDRPSGFSLYGEAPLTVAITDSPEPVTTATWAIFAFECENADGCVFHCAFDTEGWPGEWQRCTSPQLVGGLERGLHRFRVRGTDLRGRTGYAEVTWEVIAE